MAAPGNAGQCTPAGIGEQISDLLTAAKDGNTAVVEMHVKSLGVDSCHEVMSSPFLVTAVAESDLIS